jgi:hypothetical protein
VSNRSSALLGLLLTFAGAVAAQSAQPEAAKPAGPKPDNAEAAAAMERAQRMANSPMRVILQAGKIRRKGEGDAVAPAPALVTVAARPAPLRAAAAVSASPLAAAAAVDASVTASVTAPVTAPANVAASATVAPQPEPAPSPALVLRSSPLGADTPPAAAPLETVAPVLADNVPKLATPQAALPPVTVQPKLLAMVEPDIPVRVRRESPQAREVVAELKLRADGTVAEVALVAPYPRNWQSYLLAALEQWRFEPLPGPRTHRIELVFEAF